MKTPLIKGDSAEDLLDIILKALNDLVEYELAVIMKLEDDSTLSVQKARGPLTNSEIEHFQIDLDARKDLLDILNNKEPFLVPEEEDHMDTYHEILDMPKNHSCLVAPLHFENTPVGIMTLDHRICGKYSPGIVNFISTISKMISIILAQNDTSRYLLEQKEKLTYERNLLLKHEDNLFKDIIGKSSRWQSVIESVKIVGSSDLGVLIHGETGTGKEEVARLIHKLSTRRDEPFIALNCSALSSGIAESELFGHEKGSFTGASVKRKGRFELAHRGTLFLDEIGDLPLDIQPKILRVIQEGVFERVGGEKTVNCDVRIISASHVDLEKAVKEKKFREDLFYRLGVFPIHLPPLRDRGDDVILLAEHFINVLKNSGYSNLKLSRDAIEAFTTYSWPGNVRQLQNYIRRGALVAEGGLIKKEHIFPSGFKMKEDILESDNITTLDEAIRVHIERALRKSSGKIYGDDGAASILGLKPSTLQSKIKKLKIQGPPQIK